jgi:hypothetical protein
MNIYTYVDTYTRVTELYISGLKAPRSEHFASAHNSPFGKCPGYRSYYDKWKLICRDYCARCFLQSSTELHAVCTNVIFQSKGKVYLQPSRNARPYALLVVK